MDAIAHYAAKYIPSVPEPIAIKVFQLCKSGAFEEALRLVRSAGYSHYTDNDIGRFYWNAAYPAPTPVTQPEPEPENPIAVQIANGVPPRRYSKIARLPMDVRNELNTMLDDGASYSRIIEWLEENGHPGFNKTNLSDWQRTGYQEWLREAQRLQNEAIHREWLFHRVSDTRPEDLLPAMDQLFVSQMLEGIFGLDTAALKDRLAKHPRDFIALYNAYRRLKHEILADAAARTQPKPNEPSGPVKPC